MKYLDEFLTTLTIAGGLALLYWVESKKKQPVNTTRVSNEVLLYVGEKIDEFIVKGYDKGKHSDKLTKLKEAYLRYHVSKNVEEFETCIGLINEIDGLKI